MERMRADNVDDSEEPTFTRPKAERWPKVKHDDESAKASSKQAVGHDEGENTDQDTKRDGYKVEKLEVVLVKKEEYREEIHNDEKVKMETSE